MITTYHKVVTTTSACSINKWDEKLLIAEYTYLLSKYKICSVKIVSGGTKFLDENKKNSYQTFPKFYNNSYVF